MNKNDCIISDHINKSAFLSGIWERNKCANKLVGTSLSYHETDAVS